MYQSFNTFFNLHKNTEVSKVANYCFVCASSWILLFNILPWIWLQLLHTERHFSFFSVESKNNGFNFVTYFQKVLCTAQMLCPTHFRYVNKSFNTLIDFNKRTVVCHYHNFSFHNITNLQLWIECIPWMGCKLFYTKGNTFFILIKIENYNVYFFVKRHNFFWMLDTSPR